MTKSKTTSVKKHSGPSGKSGKNQLTEVKLRAEDDEIELWEVAASRAGIDRNTFLRAAANQFAETVFAAEVTLLSGGRLTSLSTSQRWSVNRDTRETKKPATSG